MEDTTNTSREALAGGLIGLLKPAVEQLDERVLAVRYLRPSQNRRLASEKPKMCVPCVTSWKCVCQQQLFYYIMQKQS